MSRELCRVPDTYTASAVSARNPRRANPRPPLAAGTPATSRFRLDLYFREPPRSQLLARMVVCCGGYQRLPGLPRGPLLVVPNLPFPQSSTPCPAHCLYLAVVRVAPAVRVRAACCHRSG